MVKCGKIFWVAPALLKAALTGKRLLMHLAPAAEIVDVRFDPNRGQFGIKVHGPPFPVIPPGDLYESEVLE
jgi:hypothetical protein